MVAALVTWAWALSRAAPAGRGGAAELERAVHQNDAASAERLLAAGHALESQQLGFLLCEAALGLGSRIVALCYHSSTS